MTYRVRRIDGRPTMIGEAESLEAAIDMIHEQCPQTSGWVLLLGETETDASGADFMFQRGAELVQLAADRVGA